tara:strand:- start:29 stop:319 length:291 start_codon:yes stop_codon:yes gene_type:complete
MVRRSTLEALTKNQLIEAIRNNNVKGYSGMRKAEVITLMMRAEHRQKFQYLEDARNNDDARFRRARADSRPPAYRPATPPPAYRERGRSRTRRRGG